jgi:hypothetical protein
MEKSRGRRMEVVIIKFGGGEESSILCLCIGGKEKWGRRSSKSK